MTTTPGTWPYLDELLERFKSDLSRYEKDARFWYIRWVFLEGIILVLGIITPAIVIYRKSFNSTDFWVWWCILTPPLAAVCAILLRVLAVQDKCSTNRRRVKRVNHLLEQARTEIPLCKDEDSAVQLLRNWRSDAEKIELDIY